MYAWVALNGRKRVNIVVIVRYARRIADGEYDVGKGKKIGVITAYCKGVAKCPNRVNE
ncbi:hypothetical protein [Streptomyces sp. SID1121]|uniref:hypothetical protein n=1 Tax=Streptomyces sp. SID1121 TaxID=3425888 RepID=UPI004056CB16